LLLLKIDHVLFRPRENYLTLFKAGFLPKQTKQNTRTAGIYTNTSAMRTLKNKKMTPQIIVSSILAQSKAMKKKCCSDIIPIWNR